MCSTLIKSKFNKGYLHLLITFLLGVNFSLAQVQQPQRFEIPLRNFEPSFEVTEASSNGLFLHRRLGGNETSHLDIIRLDTGFNEVWRGFLPIEKNHVVLGKRVQDDNIFFMLRHQTYTNFELYKIDQRNGDFRKYSIRSFIRFAPTEFQVTPQAALIGGYFNRVPLVLHYDFVTGQSKVLPGLFNDEGELTQIHTYNDGSFHLVINARNFQKQKTIWIKNYQPDGTLTNNYALKPEGNKSLLFGRSVRTYEDKMVVAGVYGNRNSEYSRGLFIATVDANGFQQLKYYNFGDLQNFFKFMKVRRESRIKERIERRKIKGKKIKFNYRFMVQEVIEHNGQYILLGEAFYPQYTSLNRNYYGSFFGPAMYSRNTLIRGDQAFDGYRYTHAVIIGFDENGKILWDNSFEINDIKTFTLEQFVRFEIVDDKIVLLYLFENSIRSKIIQDSKVIEGKTVDPLRTLFENDKPVKEKNESSRLNYWYHNYFYAAGIQNIENLNTPNIPDKRRVFFINKIQYK